LRRGSAAQPRQERHCRIIIGRMIQAHGELKVSTRGKGLYEITREVSRWVAAQEIQNGLLTVFIQHTSASLIIQENADPDVRRDLTNSSNGSCPKTRRGSGTPPRALTICRRISGRHSLRRSSPSLYAAAARRWERGRGSTCSNIAPNRRCATFLPTLSEIHKCNHR